ncbi:MAG TPA: hypothetical protein VF745_03930 [Steroidobacteraceae bacterium]
MAADDPRLESRVARIESHVAHLDATVAVIQLDLRELRREMHDGFQTLDARLNGRIDALGSKHDGKLEALRKETADGFKEMRKRLRTDLGLFFAGFSLLLSAGLGIATLIFKG